LVDRDRADIDRDRFVAADARDLALLQHAKKLHLDRKRHVADFVEEQSPAVGEFETPFAIPHRARERALFVTEQFAFEEMLGKRGAVESDERTIAAGTEPVDRPRDQFFAGTASPRIRAVALVGATVLTSEKTRSIADDVATISPKTPTPFAGRAGRKSASTGVTGVTSTVTRGSGRGAGARAERRRATSPSTTLRTCS
jgi:hypothetical protein